MERLDPPKNKKFRAATWLLIVGVAASAVVLGAYFRPWDSARTANEGSPRNDQGTQTVTVTIPIEGMTCAACVARVKRATTSIEGVMDVDVDLAEKRARVRYLEGRTSAEQISRAIADLRYKPGSPVVERGG